MLLVKEVYQIRFCAKYDQSSYRYQIPRVFSDMVEIKTPEPIYFGTKKELEDTIANKLNKNAPSTFKKVYFDCKCKYPRYKLAEYTNIKRCLNPSKADSCIITKENYYIDGIECYLIYSKSSNQYWMINGALSTSSYRYNSNIKSEAEYILNKLNYQNTVQDTIRILSQQNIISPDATIIYSGTYRTLINNDYEHFDNIINNFMKITYDTELDKFVSSNSSTLSADDLNTIDGMLGSSDPAVVAMGMKLLSSYNISNSICAVTAVICKNINKIKQNTAKTSVGFKQILQQLNITSLYDTDFNMINSAYRVSTNPADRNTAHKVVCSKIKQELEEQFNNIIRKYSNMEFNIDININ